MARRANDPELLRAQAQGGREGENAYRTSQRQLKTQRQSAVQQAMQEAALRGAPPAALAQIQNRVSAPYNQAIRSTTESAGNYAADMSARQAREYDYNQAILAGRQLIPAQIAQALAPIQAQNRFQLQSLRQEGANRIGEINVQTALQLAQLEAEERMRRLREAADAAKNRPTLTQSELQAALTQAARERINRAAGTIGGAVQQGQQQAGTAFRGELDAAGQKAVLAQANAGLYGTAGANLFEARMAGLAQDPRWSNAVGPVPAADPTLNPDAPFDFRPPGTPTTPPTGDDPTLNPDAPFDFRALPPTTTPSAQGVAGFQNAPALGGGFQNALDTAAAAQDRYRPESEQAAAALAALRKRGPEPLSQYGMLTEEQVANLPPYARKLVGFAASQGEQFNNPEDIAQLLFGAPGDIDKVTGQAEISPLAADIKQQAMLLAAKPLARRFDIGMPDVQNAILNTPETLYDIEQTQAGQPTTAQQIAADQARGKFRAGAKEQQIAANREQLRAQFVDKFGVPMPESAGKTEDVYEMALGPDSGASFQAVYDQLASILNSDPSMSFDEAIAKAFEQSGVAANLPMRQLLKAML